MTALLLAPHHDDETLFAAFTIMRERPVVAVVLESQLQAERGNRDPGGALITNALRQGETRRAMTELLIGPEAPIRPYEVVYREISEHLEFWPFRDDAPDWDAIDEHLLTRLVDVTRLYAPAYHHEGHDQHNTIAVMAEEAALDGALELVRYATYTRGTPDVRVATQAPVAFEPEWVARKLRALACYRSQIHLWPHHFIGDQREWYV